MSQDTGNQMSFTSKLAKEGNDRIYLVKGKDASALHAWYYIRVEKLKVAIFNRVVGSASFNINLQDYGEILYSGYGESPPQHIKEKMSSEFGFDSSGD